MLNRPMRGATALTLSLLLFGCGPASKEAPPTENGVYVVHGICFGEGECYRHWRASKPTKLLDRPDPASPVVATVTPGQWVETVEGQLRMLPLRGVVNRDVKQPPLAKGDVVYMLEPLGEGFYVLWHKGKTPEHDWASGDDGEPITRDKPQDPPPSAVLGWWVKLKPETGSSGWMKDPVFECMGSLAGDANCRD